MGSGKVAAEGVFFFGGLGGRSFFGLGDPASDSDSDSDSYLPIGNPEIGIYVGISTSDMPASIRVGGYGGCE